MKSIGDPRFRGRVSDGFPISPGKKALTMRESVGFLTARVRSEALRSGDTRGGVSFGAVNGAL